MLFFIQNVKCGLPSIIKLLECKCGYTPIPRHNTRTSAHSDRSLVLTS